MLHTCHGGLMRMSLLCFVFSVSVLVPLRISWKHVSVVNMFQLSAVSVVRVYHRYTPGVRHVLHTTRVYHTHTHVVKIDSNTSMWPHLPHIHIYFAFNFCTFFKTFIYTPHVSYTACTVSYSTCTCTPLVHTRYSTTTTTTITTTS